MLLSAVASAYYLPSAAPAAAPAENADSSNCPVIRAMLLASFVLDAADF